MPGKLNLEISADASKAINELNRTVAKLEENAQKARELGSAGTKAGGDMETSFAGVASSLAGVLAGAFSVQAAMSAITGEMERQRDIGKTAADALLNEEITRKRLLQITDGQLERHRELLELSEKVAESGFTQAEAQDFVFTSLSSGLSDAETLTAATFRGFEAEDTKALGESVASLRAIFGDDVFGGDLKGSMGAILKAAASSKVGASAIALQVLQAAPDASLQGSTAEETLAAFSQLTRASKSPELAATQLKSLSAEFDKDERFKDIGVIGALEKLRDLPDEDRNTFIESLSLRAKPGAVAGLVTLDDMKALLQTILAEVAAPQMVDRLLAVGALDPTIGAIEAERESATAEEGAFRERGVRTLLRGAIRKRSATALEGRDAGVVDTLLAGGLFEGAFADIGQGDDPAEFAVRKFGPSTGVSAFQEIKAFLFGGFDELTEKRNRTEEAFVQGVRDMGLAMREVIDLVDIGPNARNRLQATFRRLDAADAAEVAEAPDVVLEE